MKLPISKRLMACAAWVDPGQRVADIGTDHGYLAIYLLRSGRARRVLAADIRWTLDEPIDGVRTDVTYTHEGAELSSRVFKKEVDRDKKLILEVI